MAKRRHIDTSILVRQHMSSSLSLPLDRGTQEVGEIFETICLVNDGLLCHFSLAFAAEHGVLRREGLP